MAFPALGLQKRLLQIPYIKMRTRVAVELVQKKKNSEKLLVARSIKWLGTACGLEVFEISSIAQRIYVLLQFLNRELIHCGLAPPQFIHRIIFFVSKQRERTRIRFFNSASLRTANFFQCRKLWRFMALTIEISQLQYS